MKAIRGTVAIIEEVIHASFETISHMTCASEVVGGRETPDLKAFPVAVDLIISLG